MAKYSKIVRVVETASRGLRIYEQENGLVIPVSLDHIPVEDELPMVYNAMSAVCAVDPSHYEKEYALEDLKVVYEA